MGTALVYNVHEKKNHIYLVYFLKFFSVKKELNCLKQKLYVYIVYKYTIHNIYMHNIQMQLNI